MSIFNPSLKEKKLYESASSLFQNEAFKEALSTLEKDCFSLWSNADPKDKEYRENCFFMMKSIKKLEAILKGYLAEGEVYKKSLQKHLKKG
jgi:hypothetical protein